MSLHIWTNCRAATMQAGASAPYGLIEDAAVVTEGEERTRLFRMMAELVANFDKYQAKTDRQIPVVVPERI